MKAHLWAAALLLAAPAAEAGAQGKFAADADIKKVGEVLFQQPERIVFGFANKGDKPLRVTGVSPSCGCVDVTFPREAVPPGGRGEIVAVYDARVLGFFHKDLEVRTDASPEPLYLAAQGTVVREKSDYSAGFPIDLGNVRLAENTVEFDDVNKGDRPVAELRVLNADRTAYRPELMHLPPYLTARYIPEDIPAGRAGTIRLTLESEKLSQMGLTQTSVYLSRGMGDKISEQNEILVSAVLLPGFSGRDTAGAAPAPELYVPERSVDLGDMNGRARVSRTVPLFNMGGSDLHVRQLQVFNRGLSVSLSNRVIRPGKRAKLKVTASRDYLLKAKSRPRVLLITDDPAHAKEVIEVSVRP